LFKLTGFSCSGKTTLAYATAGKLRQIAAPAPADLSPAGVGCGRIRPHSDRVVVDGTVFSHARCGRARVPYAEPPSVGPNRGTGA